MIAFDQLTRLHGKPQSSGLLKANPEDFLVVEDLGFAPGRRRRTRAGADPEKRLQYALCRRRAGEIP